MTTPAGCDFVPPLSSGHAECPLHHRAAGHFLLLSRALCVQPAMWYYLVITNQM